jgi:hypothetical protein
MFFIKLLLSSILVISFLLFPKSSFAIEDPRSVDNNKFGIHLLFPAEIQKAAELINSSGGDWGYVTVPIQAGDKDLVKWQTFMDDAKRLHVIPIIRLATEGDYFNTKVWRKPNFADIVDFANFLNSLEWPTKNRYVLVFNEVNRYDEWGGDANPAEYAQILSYSVTVFKSKSQDFFMIASGMDNAAATVPGQAYNQYDYYRRMNAAFPGIFLQIDGINSHSYPNPAFSQPPSRQNETSIASFRFEKQLIESMGRSNLPVFITETGWTRNALSDETIAGYYQEAFETVWNDSSIVAVTPFLLRAHTPPFDQFSFLTPTDGHTKAYVKFQELKKVSGKPILAPNVLGKKDSSTKPMVVKKFASVKREDHKIRIAPFLRDFMKGLLKI